MIMKKIITVLICGTIILGCVGCGSAVRNDIGESDETIAMVESVNEEGFTDEEFFVPRTDERAVTNTISADCKEVAKQMEEVSYLKLPNWCGTSPNSKYEYGWTCDGLDPSFTEITVKEIAKEGFNFIRVPLDTRLFFTEKVGSAGAHFHGSSDNVNLKEFQNLDNLIAWCIQNGIHVCLDVHNTPGGYMIGGDEEATRKLLFTEGSKEEQIFFDFWDVVSARYADVSTNALSFNLYNEPPRFLEEEQYVRFVKRGINIVHNYTPDRLIFVDMLDYAHVPVEGLVGEPVVQTFHFYEPTSFSHANFSLETGTNRNDPILVSYPIPAINCLLREQDSYTITGSFPEGTELFMYIGMGNIGGEFSVKADNKVIFSQKITEEFINDAGLNMLVDDYGTQQFNCYEAGVAEIKLSCSIPQETEEIEFCYQHNNTDLVWLELNNLVIETANYRVGLASQWIDGVELPITNATIDERGRVTLAENLSEYEQGYNLIKDTLAVYQEFSERTGVQVMLQEFGAMYTNDVKDVAVYFDDIMTVCDEYGFSWCMWNYDGGDFSYVVLDDMFRRTGATYEEVNPGRYVPLELREVFQKHMQK
ncbi:MAG: cellulase family glycosylhydrolase [Lachnospiraceae bacterium]|nr:cellulase family glycosylhydrolase [Lachnospiraceae bacterium]